MAESLSDLGFSVELRAELDRFERNMRSAGKLVETSTRSMDKATRRAERQFERLEGVLDPVARATQRLERDTRKVAAAMDAGAVSEERATNVLRRLNQQYEVATQRAQRFDQVQRRSARGSVGMGTAIQQAGFQVGDFAVQVASGQNPLRAFIQQGTQLVSLFGPIGAVVGAAGAIGGAFVTTMLDLDEATKEVNLSTRSYNELIKLSTELTGEAAVRARELARVRRATAAAEARENVRLLEQSAEVIEKQIDRTRAQLSGRTRAGELIADTAIGDGLRRSLSELTGRLEEVRVKAQQARLELDIVTQSKGEFDLSGGSSAARKTASAGARRGPGTNIRTGAGPALSGATAISLGFQESDEQIRKAERVRAVVESLRGPYDDYIDRVGELREANEAGAITNDQYLAGIERASEAYMKNADHAAQAGGAVRDYAKAATNLGQGMSQTVVSSLNAMENGLVSFSTRTKSAKDAFRDFATSVLADIQRLIIRQAIVGPIAQALGQIGFGFASSGFNFGTNYNTQVQTGGAGVIGRSYAGTFADGGDFMVGSGFPTVRAGRDNRLVSFAARDGERVRVETPEAMRAARRRQGRDGGDSYELHVHQDLRGADPGTAARFRVNEDRIVQKAASAVFGMISQGGQAAGAVGRKRRS